MSVVNVAGTRVQCATVEGAAYLKKVVHPPSPLTPAYCGTPFRGNSQIALLELKGETDFPPVFNYNSGTIPLPVYNTINPSTMLFLTPSGGRVGSYAFQRIADDTYVQQTAINIDVTVEPVPTAPAALLSGYDFVKQYANDFSSHRIGYKSTTFYLNATAFNNQGTVASAKFKPDILSSELLSPALSGGHKSRGVHHDSHSFYERLQPKDRHNFLHAAQPFMTCLPHEVESDGFCTTANGDVGAPFSQFIAQFLNYGESSAVTTLFGGQPAIKGLLPNTIADIQMLSKSAVMRPAVEGAYVVQSNSEDVNLFIQAPVVNNASGAVNLVQCFLTWYNPTTNLHYYYLLRATQSTILDADIQSTQDIPWTEHDWSYTMFQGLSVPTSPTSTNNGLPYISVKTILGLEVQPRVFSSMRPFMRELPMPDEAALDLASILIRERPDCMPSAANDFGQIFSAITEYAPKVVDWISKAFGGSGSKQPAEKKKSSGKWWLGDVIDGLVNPTKPSKPKQQPRQVATPLSRKIATRPANMPRTPTTGRKTRRGPATDLATSMANMAIRRKRAKPAASTRRTRM